MLLRAASYVAALFMALSCTSEEGVQQVLPRSISLSPSELLLQVGETALVAATVSPSTASDKSVKWSSSNTGRLTVDADGRVTAISQGTAYVIAETTNALKASCLVTVTSASQGTEPDNPEIPEGPDNPTPDPAPTPAPTPDPTPDPEPDPTPDPEQSGSSVESYEEADYSDKYTN